MQNDVEAVWCDGSWSINSVLFDLSQKTKLIKVLADENRISFVL